MWVCISAMKRIIPFTITKVKPEDIPGATLADGAKVACYPNPTHGVVYLQGITDGNYAMMNICGIDGKLVMTQELQVNDRVVENAIDISNCQKGLYFITVQMTERTYTFKIVLN